MVSWWRIALLCLLVLSAEQGSAHLLNMTNATVELLPEQPLQLTLSIDLLVESGSREAYYELAQRPDPLNDPQIAALLQKLVAAIKLEQGSSVLSLEITSLRFPAATRDVFLSPLEWPRTEIILQATLPAGAPPGGDLRVRFMPTFVFEEPIATTFLLASTQRTMTRWLVAGQYSPLFAVTDWQQAGVVGPVANAESVPAGDTLWSTAKQYLVMGYLHILPEGTDHLLFVLGLCLGTAGFKRLCILVSVFTLAHTLSLAAVSVGIVPAAPRIVEPLILLTILWIAVENLLPRFRLDLRVFLVLCFGLIHGMGFAGALKTIGLPADAFFTALFSFNVGVELAQLTFIAGVVLLLQQVQQQKWYRSIVVRSGSLAIAALAVFWMVRLLFL